MATIRTGPCERKVLGKPNGNCGSLDFSGDCPPLKRFGAAPIVSPRLLLNKPVPESFSRLTVRFVLFTMAFVMEDDHGRMEDGMLGG